MVVDTMEWHLTLQCNIFHYSDCLSKPQPILALMDEFNSTFQHICFNGKLTANRVGRFQPRDLKPTTRNWSKVRSEIREGKVSTLVYGSLAPNGYDWQVGVVFHMFNELNRRRDPTSEWHHDSMGFWVEHTLLQEGTVTLAMWLHVMQRAWERLQGVYGFADMFIIHRTGRVSPNQGPIAAQAMRAKLWGSKAMLPTVNLRTNAPDAYWLNFLNATHIETLGGIGQIKAGLPAAQMKSLAHGGMSIQISPSPIYDSTEAWQADHFALKKVLAPILPG